MDFEAARTKMVDNQIRTTDVTDLRILSAFLTVPRERFVPEARRSLAYIDGDLPLGEGRYLMEGSPFARLVQLAGVAPEDRVLIVGSGTGYSAAVLARLCTSVVAVESSASLAQAARSTVAELGLANVTLVEGPLTEGHKAGGPYDAIFIEGAVEHVPEVFMTQLAEAGRLIVVEGYGNAAFAVLYLNEDGVVSRRIAFNCSVRPLPGFERPRPFSF